MVKDNKVLVGGAGGLLGASLVKELLNHGKHVYAADVSLMNMQDRLLNIGVDQADSRLEFYEVDLSDKPTVSQMFDSINGLSGAVNCAYPRNENYGRHFFDVSIEDFNENVSLNLGSSFLFMQESARYFLRSKTPFSLVNISSVYGVVPPKFEIYENTAMTTPVEYAAVKSALIHMAKYVTKYVSDSKFRVNVVSPGGIFDHQPEKFLVAYKEKTFGQGMLDAKDVLGTILFLLSSSAEFVNGQNIIVDDGFST